MTEDEALRGLDDAAIKLARAYANLGQISYIIRQMHDGNVRIIGPTMPADVVTDLLHKAAEGYEDNEPDSGALN